MKNHAKFFVVLMFSSLFFAVACQPKTGTTKPLYSSNSAETQTYKSVGVVKSIDADAGRITVDHEEIPGYMGAMEMTEAVRDAKMLETVKVGDKIEFDLERTGSKLLFTKLTKIGEVALTSGGEIYKTSCAECHGGLGEGATRGISLLKGHALKHSETDYIDQITNGDGKKMPAFKDKLSAEQIRAVVKFVREELQKDASTEKSAEHQH
jgi:Cu(I)/Ag(I) efflux system periplasmic protein CusF